MDSRRSVPRGQRATHSPHVRQCWSAMGNPRRAWLRTSIPRGQLNEQIPHSTQRTGSATTCAATMARRRCKSWWSKRWKTLDANLGGPFPFSRVEVAQYRLVVASPADEHPFHRSAEEPCRGRRSPSGSSQASPGHRDVTSAGRIGGYGIAPSGCGRRYRCPRSKPLGEDFSQQGQSSRRDTIPVVIGPSPHVRRRRLDVGPRDSYLPTPILRWPAMVRGGPIQPRIDPPAGDLSAWPTPPRRTLSDVPPRGCRPWIPSGIGGETGAAGGERDQPRPLRRRTPGLTRKPNN